MAPWTYWNMRVFAMETGTYEQFPGWMVATTALVSLATYLLGALILLRLGVVLVLIYACCILAMEYRVLSRSCVGCYYYDRFCCFGRGKLAALLVRKGNPEAFCRKEVRWTDILPSFLVSLVPIALGLLLPLFTGFDAILLGEIAALVLLAFPVQGFIRGRWSCRFCRQRELGCPAERLFAARSRGKAPREEP